jgi:hypothetical protein
MHVEDVSALLSGEWGIEVRRHEVAEARDLTAEVAILVSNGGRISRLWIGMLEMM